MQHIGSARRREVLPPVDAEHSKNLQDDGRRAYQVLRLSASPAHSFSNFSTGCLETLRFDGVRDALLDDYARKDALLETFHRTGRYDARDPAYAMTCLPVDHLRMNAMLCFLPSLSFAFLVFVAGWTPARVVSFSSTAFLGLFLLHAATHYHAEQISGASRESLVGETLLKMLMQKWMGKLDHGGASSAAEPAPPTAAAKLAGAVKSL